MHIYTAFGSQAKCDRTVPSEIYLIKESNNSIFKYNFLFLKSVSLFPI